jgi:polysaccharide deacetylase 2 family uncharacterized protein YibQ
MASKPQRSKRAGRRGRSGYVLSFILGALLVFLGYSYFSHLSGERTRRPGTPSRKASPADKSGQDRPHDFGFSKQDAPIPQPSVKKEEGQPSPSGAGGKPKIAIVIDDLGGENHLSRELLLLDFPLTLAILPFTTYSKPLAIDAHQKEKEVILHLPMEPYGYPKVKPGEGVLLQEMDEERLLRQLSKDIESIPNIRGVSNHMGSRLMEDPEKLKIIFSDLKRRGLFFLDSRTTPQTVGLRTARLVGLKAMERTLFIDNLLEEEAIKKNFDRLIRASLSTGIAIGIGHPHSMTIQSIREMVPKMKEKGIEIVPLSALFNR